MCAVRCATTILSPSPSLFSSSQASIAARLIQSQPQLRTTIESNRISRPITTWYETRTAQGLQSRLHPHLLDVRHRAPDLLDVLVRQVLQVARQNVPVHRL